MSVHVHVFRNGTELEPLANSVYYDFEFQDALSLPETRKVRAYARFTLYFLSSHIYDLHWAVSVL